MSTSDRFQPDDCETPRLEAWRCDMRQRYGSRVQIRFTNNRRSMVSLRRTPKRLTVLRIQKGFESAPAAILDDLALLLGSQNTAAWNRVCAFAKTIPVSGPPLDTARPGQFSTRGRYFDLQEILDSINREFFDASLPTRITWGQRKPSRRGRRRSRSLQFGSWDESLDLVRIHPALDDPRVPLNFLRYLVHHELCHAACPPVRVPDGNRKIHHPQFKALEARFPNRTRMEAVGKRLFEQITRER
jgi:hypothetical protein